MNFTNVACSLILFKISKIPFSSIATIYNVDVSRLYFFICQPYSYLKILLYRKIMLFIRQLCSDARCDFLCSNKLFWNIKSRIQTAKTTYVLFMLLICQGRVIWMKFNLGFLFSGTYCNRKYNPIFIGLYRSMFLIKPFE